MYLQTLHHQGQKLNQSPVGSIKLFWACVITVGTNVSFIGFMEQFPWSVHFSLYINLLDDQLLESSWGPAWLL